MADAFIGKAAYIYIGGKALIHLKDWDFSAVAGTIEVDPDVGTTRKVSVPGFISESGTINYAVTNDDFANIWDAIYAQTAVALYLYPSKSDATNKFYIYGNAYLTDLVHTNPLLGTVTGKVSFMNSDTTGFNRQSRA